MSVLHTVRTRDLSWRRVDDEVVVLDLLTSRYLALNGSGALLWTALVEGADEQTLAGLLVDEFDIPVEQAGADVADFVRHCRSVGILE